MYQISLWKQCDKVQGVTCSDEWWALPIAGLSKGSQSSFNGPVPAVHLNLSKDAAQWAQCSMCKHKLLLRFVLTNSFSCLSEKSKYEC